MPGMDPPPGWKPPSNDKSVNFLPPPPPPVFKVRKTEGLTTPTASNGGEDGGLPRKRKRGVRKREKYANPEKLRSIIEKHRNMGDANANADKRAYLGALKYLPHAIYKLLENMPAPWEAKKEVSVLYHTTGAITFVEEVPKVDPAVYMALWGQMWDQMRDEKRDRTIFRRMRQPPFDDEEKPMNWKDVAALTTELPELINAVAPESTFQAWEQSRPFLMEKEPPTGFDFESFTSAKALHVQVPNGPRFEDPEAELHEDDAATPTDPQRIIVRPRGFPVRVETQVTYPYLYGHLRSNENVILPSISMPVDAVVKRRDNQKAFFLDSSVTPVDFDANHKGSTNQCTSLDGLVPFLSDVKIDEAEVAHKLACYHAAYPFNKEDRKPKRPQDIALIKPLYTKRRPVRVMAPKTRRSYQRLLKGSTKLQMKARKMHHVGTGSSPSLFKLLGNTKFFERTRIDWLEAGMQLCQQGHHILQLLIHKRGLHFMHLDYNFNLKPTKTLTTKERKRSRFGNSFHLTRELLKMMKIIVDSHIQHRLGNIDAFELADGLSYVFTHMGQLTGIYRYKYRVMHQITATNDAKHVIHDRFNLDGVGKGPGCGVWQPYWRIWLAFVRGCLPVLERWLGNLIMRQFFGRVSKGIAKTVTKQRIESHYDLELRASVMQDILDVIPEQLRRSKTKVIMQHLSEAWRCWKANVPWNVPGMPEAITKVINRYISSRAAHWVNVTHRVRERIRAGGTRDKSVARKNLGRLTRLWMRAEQERQSRYVEEGPTLDAEEAVIMYKNMAQFLQAKNLLDPIPFPSSANYAEDAKLLTLALENLRNEYNMTARLTNTQREALLQIERAYDNPFETLTSIRKVLQTQRVFKNIEVSLLDLFSSLCPVYHVDAAEKIVDAYLDQYLWYEAAKRNLFPSWVKPSDDDVAPIMIRKFCSDINSIPGFWSCENDEKSAMIHLKLSKFVDTVDFAFLNQLLRLVVDPVLADYITSKMNASLSYKDMSHVQQVGIIRGLQFSSFVVQYYLLAIDLLLLGLPRAIDLASNPSRDENSVHPIRSYLRNVDDVYIAVHLSRSESEELVKEFAMELYNDEILPLYPEKKCWPRDKLMRMFQGDVQLGRVLYEEFTRRIPEALGDVVCVDASIYSADNPALLFEIGGFEVRLEPKVRRADIGLEDDVDEDAMWLLSDKASGERTGFVSLRVSEESINIFNNRIRQILMSSGSTTFAKIIKRWNTALTALATYFREAVIATPKLLDVIVKNETRVQNKVKMGLNSKMPARFPPCVFYSPEEVGGLGMLSASHILIPDADLYGKTKQFRIGMGDSATDEESLIPNIFRYINSWDAEATDSQRVWKEYAEIRANAIASHTRVSFEDLEDIWDRGLPRISTLFQKDRGVLAFDKGFRAREAFRNFSNEKYDPFWWVNSRHDGRLWNFTAYRHDVIEALGGIKTILEHTLFKATGFEDWEGLFWQKQSGFEQQMQMQKLTNAQRAGLSQIPNRRFTLWWSPTINRANVYVGFLVQLDLTGIFLHGKIPTLKISYIQIFRAHLWQKIHESLVLDLCQILDREQTVLGFDSVEKLPIHPRKSYRMNASTADILLTASMGGGVGWAISKPSALNSENDKFDDSLSPQFWIDIQLRYGDYDSHDISRYTKAKFLDYTSDGVSFYPSKTGLMICVDLAYNVYGAYGHWFPGLKPHIRQAMAKLMQSNPALYILRERIRKALQLYQSQPRQPHLNSENYVELLEGNNLIVDDSSVYRTVTRKTKQGNATSKPINGALFVMSPARGILRMVTINAETAWAGLKKLSSVSKWKAAEETANVIRNLPKDEAPSQIVIHSRGLRDPMEVNMLEFSDMKVRNADFDFCLSALLVMPQFKSIVDSAPSVEQDQKVHDFNLYDDWLLVSQPSTAFSRLMLLLRGITVNAEAVLIALKQKSRGTPPPEGFLWPALSRETWIEVEEIVSDIIVEEYTQSHGINRNSLTQSEIRDIILGQEIATPSEQRQVQALETNIDNQQTTALTTKSHNVHGDEITVVTTSRYEQQTFESHSTWQNKALEASSALHYRALNLEVSGTADKPASKLVVPRNLVSHFVAVGDVRNLTVGLLYGTRDMFTGKIEVDTIALVPQLGSVTNVSFSPAPKPSELPEGTALQLVGVIRTQSKPRADKGISPMDLMMLASRQYEDGWDSRSMAILTLNLYPGSTELQAFMPTKLGIEWGGSNRDLISETPQGYNANSFATSSEIIINEDEGYFCVPQDDLWNFAFMNTMWNEKSRAYMKIGIPIQYYDPLHRPIHFAKIGKMEEHFEIDEEF